MLRYSLSISQDGEFRAGGGPTPTRSGADRGYQHRQVAVGDLLLAVGQGQEVDPGPAERFVGEVITQLGQAEAEGMAPGPWREHDPALAHSNLFRSDDLVVQLVLEDSILMDSRGMGECVAAHDGLVQLNHDPGVVSDHGARLRQLAGNDSCLESKLGLTGAKDHDDLFQRGVAGTLAYPVDRAFHPARAVAKRRDAVGGGQSQVVVAVDADHSALDAAHVLTEEGDQRSELVR